MKKLFFILLVLLSFSPSIAQVTILDRLEYDTDDDYFDFNVIALKKDLLVTSKKRLNKKTYQYRFQKFDGKLKKLGEYEIVYQKGFTNFTHFYNTDGAYSFRYRWKKGLARLHMLDLNTMKSTHKDFIFPKKTSLSNLVVFGDMAYVEVSIRRQDDLLRIINLKTGKFEDLPQNSFKGKEIASLSCLVAGEDDDQELLIVRTYYDDDREKRNHIVQRFDKSGKQIGQTFHLNFNKKYVQNLSFVKSSDKKYYLITGACSGDNDYKPSGLFYAKVDMDGREVFSKYIDYGDIDNFYSYLSERRQAKIQKKKAKAIQKGKEFELEYNVASHHIYEHNGTYYYIGEFYYPTYRTECTTTYTNGQPVTRCRQVFDGYQYTHAVIQAFNEKGKDLWSNTFEMQKGYKPYTVQRFIKPFFKENNVVELMFIDYSWIESITFKNGKRVGEPKELNSVAKTDDRNDEVKRSSSGTMNFWHDDIVFIYGFQKVKNTTEIIGDRRRKVYFVNIAKLDR